MKTRKIFIRLLRTYPASPVRRYFNPTRGSFYIQVGCVFIVGKKPVEFIRDKVFNQILFTDPLKFFGNLRQKLIYLSTAYIHLFNFLNQMKQLFLANLSPTGNWFSLERLFGNSL